MYPFTFCPIFDRPISKGVFRIMKLEGNIIMKIKKYEGNKHFKISLAEIRLKLVYVIVTVKK